MRLCVPEAKQEHTTGPGVQFLSAMNHATCPVQSCKRLQGDLLLTEDERSDHWKFQYGGYSRSWTIMIEQEIQRIP
jgi:hypothetical protein